MRYRAFISYASADRVIGERFQRGIEHYRIPRVLRGRDYGFGPLQKRLTPLFRDRSDADAAVSLAETLRSALEQSEALVVLCSPASARSRWVNEEIRTFKTLGRETRIFPVIVGGEPRRYDAAHAPDGAFPPALFQRLDAAGTIVSEDGPEPLASDLRPTGDGFLLARLKVIAALTGVSLTELTQRQHEAERRERIVVRSVAAAMAGLAIVASVAAVQAWRSAESARERLERAIEIASRRVDDAATFQDSYGVPIDVTRQLLAGAERDFSTLIGEGDTGAPTLDMQRGRLLVLFSNLHGVVGDGRGQVALARKAVAALERVSTARELLRPQTWLVRLPAPEALVSERLGAIEALGKALAATADRADEATRRFEEGRALAERTGQRLYVARFWSLLGEHRYAGGNTAGALESYRAAIRVLDRTAADGGGADAIVERALAHSDAAEVLLEIGRHGDALEEQTRAVTAFEQQCARAPGVAVAQRHLAQALVRQGDMKYAVLHTWTESMPLFERALAIFEQTHASDKARVDYARELSIALDHVGDVMLQTGAIDRARATFGRSLALRRDVLARDPGNPEAARDVAVALERQGDIALAERAAARCGNDAARAADWAARALAAYDEARALRRGTGRPASAEPGSRAGDGASLDDTVLARDLAVLWARTGGARFAVGGLEDWRAAYDTAIRMMRELLARENALADWRRDLVAFRASYADALRRSGRIEEALAQWNAALALTRAQLADRPEDLQLQDDERQLRGAIARAGLRRPDKPAAWPAREPCGAGLRAGP
jgi:tetratricopeptide (TPR) repeat protein